ncbi:tumor necrosis factor receptor superfamily member 6 isoform X2 [Lates calcarifer]|uniref:Tumor necrosis factor receptor superfamily member 6 isoform X2 n=2 Tax=Lates calcarifer TaxID=8187 RepID=A0AAJ7VGA6_LATCA|nr:tumor necrosis factor receptor superfamily member 6 isoform X2 [Lates calcarifer]
MWMYSKLRGDANVSASESHQHLRAYHFASSQTEGKETRFPIKALLRHRRQTCEDGTYEHEGKPCCLCGAGLKLESHCLKSIDDRQCSPCEQGEYHSQPNFQPQCDPCTSCEHPNANLEVEEPCTRARDTKCRCKKNHFCSDPGACKICQPCRECHDEGVKVPCTAKNNTVCNDKIEGGNTGTIIAIIVPILLIALLALIGLWCWRKRKSQGKTLVHQPNINMELEPLEVSDIEPHLSDIAEELGWKDMKDVAIRCGIPPARIESCELNHRGDAQEATLELLRIWVEREGSGAGRKLIQILQNSNKKRKAEKVTDILRIDCAA